MDAIGRCSNGSKLLVRSREEKEDRYEENNLKKEKILLIELSMPNPSNVSKRVQT